MSPALSAGKYARAVALVEKVARVLLANHRPMQYKTKRQTQLPFNVQEKSLYDDESTVLNPLLSLTSITNDAVC